jgi:hypothetical protein
VLATNETNVAVICGVTRTTLDRSQRDCGATLSLFARNNSVYAAAYRIRARPVKDPEAARVTAASGELVPVEAQVGAGAWDASRLRGPPPPLLCAAPLPPPPLCRH